MKKKVIAFFLITAMALGGLTACSIFTDIELEVNEAFEEHELPGGTME